MLEIFGFMGVIMPWAQQEYSPDAVETRVVVKEWRTIAEDLDACDLEQVFERAQWKNSWDSWFWWHGVEVGHVNQTLK